MDQQHLDRLPLMTGDLSARPNPLHNNSRQLAAPIAVGAGSPLPPGESPFAVGAGSPLPPGRISIRHTALRSLGEWRSRRQRTAGSRSPQFAITSFQVPLSCYFNKRAIIPRLCVRFTHRLVRVRGILPFTGVIMIGNNCNPVPPHTHDMQHDP